MLCPNPLMLIDMKCRLPLLLMIFGMISPLSGQTAFETELSLLQQRRDKALAAAVDPIDRRYEIALEALLKKATQAGDLDAALKLREMLKEVTPAAPVQETAEQLLKKGEWTWFSGAKPHGTIKFLDDNKMKKTEGLYFLGSWKMTGLRKFEIHDVSGNHWTFEFNMETKEAKVIAEEGALNQDKTLKMAPTE